MSQIHLVVEPEIKKALEERARQSGKTLKDFLVDLIQNDKQKPFDQPRIDSKTDGQELAEPEHYDCLWEYKEATSYQGGNWEFEIAECRPKSADNELSVLEVLKYACPRCKVFLLNKRISEKSADGKASKIIDLALNQNEDDRPGYLARQAQRALSAKYKCAECDFETDNQSEAARHQEKGYRHWFPQ